MGRNPQEPTSPTHNRQPNLEDSCLSSCPIDDTASGLHLHRQTLPQCRLAGKDGKLLPGLSPSAYTNTHTHILSFGSLGNRGVGVNRVYLSPVQEPLRTPQPKGHSASGPWASSQTALAFCVAEAEEEGGASNNRTSGETVLRDPTVCSCAPATSDKPDSTEMLCMDEWRGPSFPEGGTGPGPGTADCNEKSSPRPGCTPFPHRPGVVSAHLPPLRDPAALDLGGYFSHSYSARQQHLAMKVGAAEQRLTWRGGSLLPPQAKQQQLLPKAQAWATLPLTSWLALDKAPCPEPQCPTLKPESEQPTVWWGLSRGPAQARDTTHNG